MPLQIFDAVLANPVEEDLTTVLARWSITDIRMLVKGNGRLARDAIPTLHKLRGAIGRVLALGASESALVRNANHCSFDPPCGYHIFHNDLKGPGRDGRLPKPYVLRLDDCEGDLMMTMRVIGHAAIWGAEFQSALVAAARLGLDRPRGDPLTFTVLGTERSEVTLPPPPPLGRTILLTSLTPIVQRRDADRNSEAEPGPISGLAIAPLLSGLRFRVEGLAAWHGLRPRIDVKAVIEQAIAAAASAQEVSGENTQISRGGGKTSPRPHTGWTGTLRLPAPGPTLRPLLWFATQMHLGADTQAGAGRIRLTASTF